MKYSAKIGIATGEVHGNNLIQAISPELSSAHEKRSKTTMNINKNVLSLEINASDLTALKASFNSYMKLIILCNSLQEA